MSHIRTSYLLTYLGIVPFGLCSFSWVYGYNLMFEFKIYSALILSFLGGINWGLGLKHENFKVILYSVFPAIFAWLLFFLGNNYLFLLFLIFLFTVQIIADYKIHKLGLIEKWFLKLRFQATAIVIISILVAIYGVSL